MSKFNTKPTGNKTENLAGGEAYAESPKLELASLLLTSFVQDQYYRNQGAAIDDVKRLIASISDKTFPAKAAIYARQEFGMRSISHVVAGEIAGTVHGTEWAKRFFDKVVRRPDDMLEILAYYHKNYGKTEPNALKKGFAQAFSRFDAYQLGKWRRDGQELSLVDLVNLVHPKPTEALTALIKGELKNEDTVKAKLSRVGTNAKTEEEKDLGKNAAWKELVLERKIGYMSLVFNLRNIIEQAPEVLPAALEMLIDEKLIRKSLILPFRFITALGEVTAMNGPGVQDTIMALSQAIDIAMKNVPVFDGDTLVVLDESGSMGAGQSRGSEWGKTPATIGALFAAVFVKANKCDLLTFSNAGRYQSVNPMDSTLTIAQGIQFVSGGTDFGAIFEAANRPYDRMIILSDMQGWVGYTAPNHEFEAYKSRTGASPQIFSFDLQGYGTLQFPEKNVFAIAGFSEKVFDLMRMLGEDRNALVNRIEAIEL